MLTTLLLSLVTQCCCTCSPCDAGVGADVAVVSDAAASDLGLWSDAAATPADGGLPDTGTVPADAGTPVAGGSAGCGKTPPYVPGTYPEVTLSNGRKAILGIPASYDQNAPLPLITGWCGQGWDAYSCRINEPKLEAAAAGQALLIWPQKSTTGSGAGWDFDPARADMQTFDAALAFMLANYCVASSRVYAYGRSYGGGMVEMLAAHRANKVAAIAVTIPFVPNYSQPTTPVHVWEQMSTTDSTLGGANYGKQMRDKWAQVNGCSTSAPATPAANATLKTVYVCALKDLTFIEWNSLTHSPTYNVGLDMWNFFKAH